ncbi:hypothetical protein HP548_02480 [Paenibacillus taichungensis]|uniref:HTH cro/C1-type domain-containing protein n=1 Tax=Paenibacillus taichungensis TaxID=484184 RepID=A0ABX2MGD1_9BACL|nr:hypothetical protein [Paenibacillus taichungensis]NUU52961.1 hypothetical protein [Paenibacillus taichungensis]
MKNEYLAPEVISLGDKVIELLSNNGMVLDDLSREIGLSNERLVPFFMGSEEVTQDFAEKLAKVFSPPADFWLELDKKYHESLKNVATQ